MKWLGLPVLAKTRQARTSASPANIYLQAKVGHLDHDARSPVLCSCTGSQEPLQRTKQYTTANQWLLNKEKTMVIPLWTGTPG